MIAVLQARAQAESSDSNEVVAGARGSDAGDDLFSARGLYMHDSLDDEFDCEDSTLSGVHQAAMRHCALGTPPDPIKF